MAFSGLLSSGVHSTVHTVDGDKFVLFLTTNYNLRQGVINRLQRERY
jgi:hypothetical protein